MTEFKLIVAGGRDFDNQDLLIRVLNGLADVEYADQEISIVTGMARGADRIAYEFAQHHQIHYYPFPADWDRYGKRAGFVRNEAMAKFSDGLLAFWDGQSRGTGHMVNTMRGLGKPVHVVQY
jgi:hypothetical protein